MRFPNPGLGRFRVNVFHQRSNVSMVLRYITAELPTLDELGMPEQMKELVMLRRGLDTDGWRDRQWQVDHTWRR